jgi:DNA-binding NarL/FixJ family response regulator
MQIEKVSKIITVNVGGSTICDGITTRKVIMSLPRVKFLEGGEGYVPPPTTEELDTIPDGSRPLYTYRNISSRERIAYDLRQRGLTIGEICGEMGVSESAARSYVASAKRKKEFGLK